MDVISHVQKEFKDKGFSPTALGAGTGGTAAPVIHCFGAQRAVEKPRSENEASSHWSVLKTRAFWVVVVVVVSLCGSHKDFFVNVLFWIAIGFLASSSSMKAIRSPSNFQTTSMSHVNQPHPGEKNWNSLQLHHHHLPPPTNFCTLCVASLEISYLAQTKRRYGRPMQVPIGSELRNT